VTVEAVVKQIYAGGSDFAKLTDKPSGNIAIVWTKCLGIVPGDDLSKFDVSVELKTAVDSVQIALPATADWTVAQTNLNGDEQITSAIVSLKTVVSAGAATLIQ
jgi:hypothetical protein